MVAAFAEFEHEIMRSRTMDGLAAARARGRLGGRKPKLSDKQIAEVTRLYKEQRPVQEIAELFGVSRPTIYRVMSS
jgi:DNA invertase Pin-like site-specific DNA recombinase